MCSSDRLAEIGEGDGNQAVNLVTMMGIGTMTGRLSSGLIMSLIPRFGARSVAAFTILTAGLIVICCTFFNHLYYQFGMMMLFGASIGEYQIHFSHIQYLTYTTATMSS